MRVIVCLDDHNGMMFNHRRQSQDRVLRADIMELTKGKVLWMNAYSKRQFTEDAADQIRVDEEFLKKAGDEDYCFVENADISDIVDLVREIWLYKWNRDYPADVFFPIDMTGWRCEETKEFSGSSHETITRERYVRQEQNGSLKRTPGSL